MKHVNFLLVAVLVLASATLFAQEPDGLTCENAIPVDTSYVGNVPAAGVYYYSASTYDLPMTCYFYPETPIEQAPKVYVDFTCTPGIYDDPNIVKLLDAGSGWGIALPLVLTFTDEYDQDYNKYYSLTIGESYRELMAQCNITYNVDAIVTLNAPCAGEVRLAPDTIFKACMDNSVWLNMPDTIATGLLHEGDSYVLPFADWKNDSIQFRWTGSTPVTIWIGETCEFEFTMEGAESALDMFVLRPDAGNNEHIRTFSKKEMSDYVSLYGKGGIYYMRVVCAEDGELIVEKKPMNEAMAKAIPIAMDQPVEVLANASEQVYYFPATWENYSMLWAAASSSEITAYFSNTIDFAKIVDSYTFSKELLLSKKQMKVVCTNAIEHVFVKFVSSAPTTITSSLWAAGACAENADELFANDSVRLQRNATTTAWRVNIAQWAQQDVKLYWKGTSSIKMFLCDTCKGFTLNKTNQHVKLYKEVSIASDGSRDTLMLSKDELAAVAQYADADGFLYFRFNNSATGSMIVMSETEEPIIPDPILTSFNAAVCFGETYDWNDQTYSTAGEHTQTFLAANGADSIVTLNLTIHPQTEATTEPVEIPFGETYEWNGETYTASGEYTITLQDANGCDYQATLILTILPEEKPVNSCVENSELLDPVANLTLSLKDVFDVYRIDCEKWMESGVNLVWKGAAPLHTFVAEDCVFAVAKAHIDVVNYTEVPAEGQVVLSKEILAGLAQYKDLDGFLYVRFATEFEGELTIVPAE